MQMPNGGFAEGPTPIKPLDKVKRWVTTGCGKGKPSPRGIVQQAQLQRSSRWGMKSSDHIFYIQSIARNLIDRLLARFCLRSHEMRIVSFHPTLAA